MYYTDGYLFLISLLIYLAIFIIFTSKKKIFKENKSFLLLCFICGIYCFGNYGFLRLKIEEDFWYWQKIIRISSILIPVTILLFIINITKEKNRINKWIIVLGYLIAATLIFAESKGMYIKGYIKENNLLIPQAGRYFGYIIGYYILYTLYSFYLLFRYYNILDYLNEKRYIRTIIFAFCLFSLASILNVMGLYTKRIGFLPEVLVFASTATLLTSITKYNVVQMSLNIRKSFIYGILSTTITALFLITILLCERMLEYFIGFRSFFPAVIFALIIAPIFQPLRNKVQLFIDRSFFKSAHDKQRIIRELSKNITTILDKKSLVSSVVNIIIAILHVDRVSIFLKDLETGKFCLTDSPVMEKKEKIEFDPYDSIPSFMENERRELLKYNIKEEKEKSKRYEDLDNDMEIIGGELCLPIIYKGELLGFLSLGKKLSGDNYNDEDIEILWMLCNETAISLENIRIHNNTKERFLSTVKSLVEIIESRNPYIKNHGKSVAYYSAEVARELGLPSEMVEAIRDGGNLHDIGMIGVRDEILTKRDRLTEEEFASIREHPNIGRMLLVSNIFPKEVYDAVQAHHESISGDGYPNSLEGNAVLMAARIVAVANAYDAMRSDRPYRKALDKKEAINELLMSSGKRFDKKVVDAFIRILNREDALREKV
jgi:putative nucleotidyltransferase with HDIG domain